MEKVGLSSQVSFPHSDPLYRFLIHRVGVALNRVLIFGIGFHRIRTIGSPAPSTIAPIRVVAPHSSFFDLLLCCLDCVPTSVAKADARNVPIFGR